MHIDSLLYIVDYDITDFYRFESNIITNILYNTCDRHNLYSTKLISGQQSGPSCSYAMVSVGFRQIQFFTDMNPANVFFPTGTLQNQTSSSSWNESLDLCHKRLQFSLSLLTYLLYADAGQILFSAISGINPPIFSLSASL